MKRPASPRIASIDLIRGVAVLGILAVNAAGFAGPIAGTTSPNLPVPGTAADEAAFAATFLLFEGKMRALFCLLFGASLELFLSHAEADGRDGTVLQLRRLGWLALFGYLHYVLFWWGDILFIYALSGMAVLAMRAMRTSGLIAAALLMFAAWHGWGAWQSLPDVRAEEQVRLGTASTAQAESHIRHQAALATQMARELVEYRAGFGEQARTKLTERPLWPVMLTLSSLYETVPLMVLGLLLYRSGFFASEWPPGRMRKLALGATALGGGLTLVVLGWAWSRHFPPIAMRAAFTWWMALPHVLMAIGYAAILVRLSPRLLATRAGLRLEAAGRMAFSNYIACTVAMTALFYGWGLGLVGQVGAAGQLPFIAAGWLLMLGCSRPWLTHFRQGPLEWLWRVLTERRVQPFRR